MSKRLKDISSLTLEQRAILEARLRKKRENVSRAPAIPRRPDAASSVLSFAQQRLWFLDQLEPGNPFYNGAAAVRLKGPLKVEALRQSLDEIVRRHEILRTTFRAVDGQPFQVVNEWRPLGLPLSDLTVLTGAAREDEVTRLAAEEVRQPFNLAEGPLLRVSLLRLAEDEHVLLLVMHHIIGDGWSAGIFIGELAKLYEAFSTGTRAALADLPAQYADFAHWQRGWLQGDVLDRQLSYWKQVLAGAPTVLDLQTDRPRPVAQSFRGARQSFQIPETVSDELRELSKREGVTLYMTLLAAFQTLLHRYTSQREILVGSPIAGRNLSETEGLIGFFANTLVMRADFTGDPSWRELLHRVRESALGAYAHQELPFERLVEELQPERDLSRSPLIQAMLVLQNTPMPALELSGITLSLLRIDNMAARFDLYLAIEDAEQLTGTLEYNTDLFDASTISRFISHFQQLLRNIPAATAERVSHLPFLSEAERGRLLFECNDTFAEYPREASLHQLFEAQVEQTPDAIAVVFESEHLSYRQLNERANQLAHYLRRQGVGPESLVAISIERSLEMVVGLLGILKAGGAYVPLDPAYPQSRLSFMLADAGVRTLLTQRSLVEVLPPCEARVICIDSDWDAIRNESSVNPVGGAHATNLAYVIYTSGSTGQPKGVQIQHGAVVNFLTSMQRRPGLTGSDVLLAVTTLSFDIAGLELYLPLIVGARLVIVSREVVADGAWLLGELRESGVTVMQATPATWRMLLTEGWEGDKHLKALCGGEALTPELASQISERTASLWNMYGPTETTIWSMLQEIGANDNVIPIGRPISNTQVYLLDQHLRPVATGLRGDLYIGGDGLARGYLNQPGLTAERFVPHPFSVEKGARLYRTGDVGRRRENGVVEYLGRTDHQVKLRGYRIELGEVEAALRMQEGVQEAVAIVRDGAEAGQKSLVAYVVKTGSGATTTSSLREGMRARLPEYMIPSIIVELEELPLTANGKVDRARLPEPERSRVELDAELVLPRTPTEEVIAGLWADVLKVDEVGIHDNFFQLGGHSLLATQLISRIRDAFLLELPLRFLFESPTVAALSRTIDLRLADAHGLHLPPILPVSREQELPLSFAQQRLWFLDQFEPGNPFYNIAAALRLNGQLDADALAQSLDEVAVRHESLRTTFISRDGLPVQLIGAPCPFNLEIIDLTHITEQEREAEARRLAAEEAQRPFDLSVGPLLRVSLLKMAEDEHILLFTMHHIIGDGWSIGVLVREVSALYAAFTAGEPSPLPELSVQYADFAHWQREWLQGEVLEAQLSYWKEQLAGAPVLQLPTDRPRPAVQSYRGAHHSVRLDAALTEELKRLSRHEGVTLFMLLLAAFQTLLSRYSGQQDIVVGSPIANRTRAEVEGLIGFFVNTLVLRTRLAGSPSFREVLGRVREAALGAYAHQDVPFEMLVEELEPERDMSRTPLFQVMFVLQNAPQEAVQLSGVELNSIEVESGTAKFDLTLSLTEAGGGLQGGLEYRIDLFDASSISRLVSHFEILLRSVIGALDEQIARLAWLSEAERRQLICEWNDTFTEFPRVDALHHLFEAQVEQTPDALAVIFESEQLTYRQLNARANQLAHHLISLGAGPESLVAICLERSTEMVVALLAVLKSGAAYVPLDPHYPRERLRWMLEDAQPRVVVTSRGVVERVGESTSPVVLLDEEWAEVERQPEDNPCVKMAAENLAYVIYTSGSTGRPKGVGLPHRALVNLIHWHASSMLTGRRTLQFASLSFDASIHEMFAAWCGGGTLYVPGEEVRRDRRALARYLNERGIEKVILPVVVLQQLAEESVGGGEMVSHLREVTTTGEQMQITSAIVKLFKMMPQCRLHNHYGPTESHVVTALELSAEPEEWRRYPTIGRPIANSAVYVLDGEMKPVAVGVVGEVYIGGAGLARGYVNRAEMTAERFVPHPYSESGGERLYRTGDEGRVLANGEIEYLGRRDQQVKVRGYRIELGEVEARLGKHPSVREAVVVARADADEEGAGKRLVAYVVASEGAEIRSGELRSYMGEELPEYMIPSLFVELEELPLTANGKVDRARLPEPERSRVELDAELVLPRTPAEEVVAEVWARVLGLDQIGVRDNFFQLGGHSLLTTQMVSRLRDIFRVEIPLRSVFQSPTIEGVVDVIAEIWGEREIVEEIARTFKEVEQLSESEVETTLYAQE